MLKIEYGQILQNVLKKRVKDSYITRDSVMWESMKKMVELSMILTEMLEKVRHFSLFFFPKCVRLLSVFFSSSITEKIPMDKKTILSNFIRQFYFDFPFLLFVYIIHKFKQSQVDVYIFSYFNILYPSSQDQISRTWSIQKY